MDSNKQVIGFTQNDGSSLCLGCYRKNKGKAVNYILEGSKGTSCFFCKNKISTVYKQLWQSLALAWQKAEKKYDEV